MIKPIQIALAPTRNRPVNVFLGIVLALAAILLFLALATYHPADPSLNTSVDPGGAHAVKNWIGPFGAGMSDLSLQALGFTSFFIPVWMGAIAWGWMHSRWNGAVWLRALGTIFALVFFPAVFGLVPWHWRWLHAVPVEGVLGRIVSALLVGWLNVQGAWIVAGALAAAGAYFALAVRFRDVMEVLGSRWGHVESLGDRWRNWREERAERKAGRNEFKEEQENPGPSQRFFTGNADGEEDAPPVRTPSRLAALFGRRNREVDEVQDVPAYQRQRGATEQPGPVVAPAPAPAAAAPAPRRASIWERSVEAAPAVSAAAAAFAEAQTVAHAAPMRAAVPESAPEPAQIPVAERHFEERIQPARSYEPVAEEMYEVPVAPRFAELAEPGYTPVPEPIPMPEPVAAPVQAIRPAQPIAPQPRPEPRTEPSPRTVEIHERADVDERTHVVKQTKVSGFKLPPSTLLNTGSGPQVVRENELREEAQILVEKCAEFDVRGQVVQINPGPMVTTYEFKPEAGVKYSRVTGLADDLCLAMRAESILIERMAGKSTVGIQVPNHERETIHLRDVLESETFAKAKSRLTLAMGKDINGRIVTADLASMPHVLIAGSTGSGKSVAINAMIMSLLFRTTPQQVRLILVDPKRVELGMYEGVPHLFTPIITEPKLAANALRNAVREMERRLKLLASRSVRNIDQYNKLYEEGSTPSLFEDENGVDEGPLPYIVIVIDELADLMMLDRANVEESITRLAQMARAVGIHLVLATQRPSVDVITGLIKANVPTRISFRLSTKVDSRTIIDTNGAEALLGRGDMLFLPPGTSRLMRLHAPYVSEKETAAVVSFWKEQGAAEYAEGFLESPKDERVAMEGGSDGEEEDDPMFDDAVRLVFEFGKASTSLLQRRLRIGYGRAAHLIDLMERDGLVGPADGSRPRELLKAPGWLHEVSATAE